MGLTTYYTELARSAFLQATLPRKVTKSNVRNSLIADCEQTDESNPAVAIRPQPSGPKPGGIRRSLPAPPISAVGMTTRQCRGVGGGHQAVHAFDLHEKETGEAAT